MTDIESTLIKRLVDDEPDDSQAYQAALIAHKAGLDLRIKDAEIERLTALLATSRSETASAHLEGEKLAASIEGYKAIIADNAASHTAQLTDIDHALHGRPIVQPELLPGLKSAAGAVADVVVERDRLRIQLRRAEAQALPALFLLLGDAQEMPISGDEYATIFDTCLVAEEPTPIPLPASCLADGKPDLRRLFRLAEDLRREYRGQPVAFWLRAEQAPEPSRGSGHEGGEGCEAAIMCRRAQT